MRSPCSTRPAANARRLLTYGPGGPSAHCSPPSTPQRVGALIMYSSVARTSWAPDYDWAMTAEDRAAWTERTIATWGEANSPGLAVLAPSMADDPR